MSEMAPRYEPQGVEERWQRTWEQEGLYNAEVDPARTPYVDAHPPPNVTGELHIGHALQLAIGDTMIRWKRMAGFNTLFQPGYDHAGISTQNVVEKVLLDEGTSRQELGREAFVPWTENRVPVIADERVEPEFGTGALKITPGHDPTDFQIGRDHGLPEPMCIGPDGRVTAKGLEGLTQQEAEQKILTWAKERGLLEKREHYRHSVARCERCETRIEPLISMQWWCSMDEIKQPALAALRERRVAFHPESQHRYAIDSLENAPDWCISRQIWWGHQLPAWFCPDGHISVAE